MAPKKKTPMTIFLEEKKRLPENRSLRMDVMARKYSNEWKSLDADGRKPYADRAKKFNEERKGTNLLTNIGTALDDEMLAEQEEERYQEFLLRLIEVNVFDEPDIEKVKNKSFFIVSFNVMCGTREGRLYANEIGVAEFSIAKGIVSYFHLFIDPGEIPVGYARSAKEHSESTHKIPLTNFSHARGNERKLDGSIDEEARQKTFSGILLDIVEMLKPTRTRVDQKNPMIVFAKPDQIKQIRGCFRFLCEESKEFLDLHEDIEVLDVVALLSFLAERINKPRPMAAAEGDLNLSTFDYSPNTNCAYHDELDVRFCALGVAKRICYMLSDVLCRLYEITPTESHMPPRVDHESQINEYVPNERLFNYEAKTKFTWRDAPSSLASNSHVNQPFKEIRAPKEAPPGVAEKKQKVSVVNDGPSSSQEPKHMGWGIGRGKGRGAPPK